MSLFSVLICTYRRQELLRRALQALIEGTTEKPDEVVVVNGGDAEADRAAEAFRGRHGIELKLVKTVNKNLAASRNIGLSHCTGEIVAMTDDDAEVFPDWVLRMRQAHREHPEAGAVGGSVIGRDVGSLVLRAAELITFPSWPQPRYVNTLPGVNISYKREALRRLGPQDETLFRGEDVDFNWRLQKLGYKILFEPSIRVHHRHRPDLGSLLRQYWMYGRAYYRVRRKWEDMYCVYPHRLRRPKDFLKAVNFFAAPLYEPWLLTRPVRRLGLRLSLLPVLFSANLAWRGGMLWEGLRHGRD